ncbi:hypothetical protein DEO72_LG10g2289 [Vigna unguiculata]|uniref:Uncharacterized protein n=1 Tax=Vigna unguiculata TaxID=3917 RepID=A0A4D6NBH6_VIGUN|nr:hypothetical protein DEO72_LG10g2289 [Vigna unguiculata]
MKVSLIDKTLSGCPNPHFALLQKIQQPLLSFPLTERSARLFSRSRDSSASYRAAKASVNPSSRYGKLESSVCLLFRRSRDSSASYRAAKASVNPPSRYGKLESSVRLVRVKIVAGTDKPAQASWSRLGEINSGSPKPFFHEWSPRRPTVILSERASRPGERGLA